MVEAADDICYLLLDFEDGFRLGIVKFEDIKHHYLSLLLEKGEKKEAASALRTIKDQKEQVGLLRSLAINSLIRQVSDAFVLKEQDMLHGKHNEELTKSIPSYKKIAALKKASQSVYRLKYNLEIESAGFEVLGGLLDAFVPAVINLKGYSPSHKSKSYSKLLAATFWNSLERDINLSTYDKLMRVTDYVSGMTDSFAVGLYRKIKGIALPSLE